MPARAATGPKQPTDRDSMGDIPLAVLAATISVYWLCVGAMVVRVRRQTHRLLGVIPEQRSERYMWLVWVPLVAAWIALPWLAQSHQAPPFGLPAFALLAPFYPALRWIAAGVAVLCLALTIKCWLRMGRNWRMDVSLAKPAEIITDGLFKRIRHPIYAFSMLLMVCSAAILPNLPMIAVAVVHIVLNNLKARNEERVLLRTGGDDYAQYLRRTGRFLPRFGA
jgi:protein-S-isoprenylcysteine O-methyltransferase Ste14